jgi:hypothetical protein
MKATEIRASRTTRPARWSGRAHAASDITRASKVGSSPDITGTSEVLYFGFGSVFLFLPKLLSYRYTRRLAGFLALAAAFS